MSPMARLDLSLLGTFRVSLDQRPLTSFRSANNQGLLAYLALNNNHSISREVLAALLWPDESDDDAHNNLRQAIFRLRQLLGDGENGDIPYLTITRQSVQFNPNSDYSLDVDLFLRAIESHDLDAAAAAYTGELLPGFTCNSLEFEDWLRLEREQLHRLALEAMFEAAQDHLAARRFDKALMVARRQLALEPWREPAHRQSMQAYALGGDRTAALAQFEACREILEVELGIAPSQETIALMDEIKSGRFGRLETDEIIRPPARIRHNLPADTTPFIGREAEMTEIRRFLVHERRRLVTIVGPGGMGKTRLAMVTGLSLLPQFEDGVYLVDLAAVEQPEGIAPAIATALEYRPPDPALELKPQLLDFLAQRNLLLILDNFEQIPGGATMAGEILRLCPNVALLITSRERLNLTSESRYELGGLDYPTTLSPDDAMGYTAVRLFVDSGRRARPGFELTGNNVADVIRICRLVGGMPLGLILAAGWLEILKSAEIAIEIERGLEFLAGDMADLPERQRSMRAVFDRSWRGLSPEEAAVMARLSIFRGGFTRESAENVAGANLRILLALVNKSLLQRRTEDGRFDIHELLRQYAAEQRRQIDPDGLVELAHCREFARLVDAEASTMPSSIIATDRLTVERDNLRRAWAYAVDCALAPELAMLAPGIRALGEAEGSHHYYLLEQAWQSLQQSGLPKTHPDMMRFRTRLLNSMQGFETCNHIRDLLFEFAPFVEASGDLELRNWLYSNVACVLCEQHDIEALTWAEKRLSVALEIGDEFHSNLARAARLEIRIGLGRGDDMDPASLNDYLAYFESRETSRSYLIILGLLQTLTQYHASLHDHEQAVYYGNRYLNKAKSGRNLYNIGSATSILGKVRLEMGQTQMAADHLLDNLDWHLAIGKVWQTLGAIFSTVLDFNFMPLFGGWEEIVPILSMVHHHPEAIPLHREQMAACLPVLETEIGPETYAAAWERGKALDFGTAVAWMRAALSPNSDESI